MTLPMMGTWTVRLHEVRPFTIHGDSYYELVVERAEEPGRLLGLRTSAHAVEEGVLRAGGRVAVSFLMGQVTGVRAVTEG